MQIYVFQDLLLREVSSLQKGFYSCGKLLLKLTKNVQKMFKKCSFHNIVIQDIFYAQALHSPDLPRHTEALFQSGYGPGSFEPAR